jgi:hypothetical protein
VRRPRLIEHVWRWLVLDLIQTVRRVVERIRRQEVVEGRRAERTAVEMVGLGEMRRQHGTGQLRAEILVRGERRSAATGRLLLPGGQLQRGRR